MKYMWSINPTTEFRYLTITGHSRGNGVLMELPTDNLERQKQLRSITMDHLYQRYLSQTGIIIKYKSLMKTELSKDPLAVTEVPTNKFNMPPG